MGRIDSRMAHSMANGRKAERPQYRVREPLRGHTVETVTIALEKHATKCVISGEIQYQNIRSRAKHLRKWEMVVLVWFWNSSIEAIISEPFVTWSVDEEKRKSVNLNPMNVLLERQSALREIKNQEK